MILRKKRTNLDESCSLTSDYIIKYNVVLYNGYKNKNRAQLNRIESPQVNLHTYSQICSKGRKNVQWKKDNLFNKWCWENWTATCKKK